MISITAYLTTLGPSLSAAEAIHFITTDGASAQLVALPPAERATALAALMPLLDIAKQRFVLEAAAAIEVEQPGARTLAAIIPHLDPALWPHTWALADALPEQLSQRLLAADSTRLRQEVIQALAFTGMPDGTDAERAAYLRGWQRPPATREERFLAVAFGAEAFLRWGFAQDAHAQELAQVVLKQLVEEARLEVRQAIWRLENPRGAALAAEIATRLQRIEQTVDELAVLDTEQAIARGITIADPRDRADVLFGLAFRAMDLRRMAFCQAAIGAIHAILDPLLRCLTACRVLSLLPAGPDRIALVASALDDLRTMEPEAQPFAASGLVVALAEDERAQLRLLSEIFAEQDRAGVGKVSVLAALIPYTRGPDRQQLRAQARRIARSLSASTPGASEKSLRAEALEHLEHAHRQATAHRK